MAKTNISRIDTLWSGSGNPIAKDEADRAAVGAIQDLLLSHGAPLPGILETGYGSFGDRTHRAVRNFQEEQGLNATGVVDTPTLNRLATAPASSPIAACGYVALALDLPWSGFTRVVALTAQFEAAGKFTARNRNTDGAGLSFGIIQWAQKPGRLNGLLRAFARAQPDRFTQVFGGGSPVVGEGLLKHTAKPRGGTDQHGHSTDPAYDLVNNVWNARFIEAGRDRIWQKTQIDQAMKAFRDSYTRILSVAPLAKSERSIAFLLDVANQHGDGGLGDICKTVANPSLDEPGFLVAVENESVRRLKAQFGATSAEAIGTERRRKRFRLSPLLSDTPFKDDE